ncbi:MAG: hypothetical protein WAW85_12710 [Gordonia sp. (in: high G+C Gram-positive bacteria)]|uniref:hypothetical protein n=1 Tax=Gordonia sp. (in: high G+C Gram-positive bacteria) TaxID=84139 RepID=UPI003BB63655
MPDTPDRVLPAERDLSRRTAIAGTLARSLEITGRGLRLLIFSLATLAALIGLLAMVVGVLSWQHADQWRIPFGVVIVMLLCLPAVTLPFLVHRRLAPITRAIEHPDALARQALDYVGDVRSGTELTDLAAIATRGPSRVWRIGSLLDATKLVFAFTSRVTPDSDRQPLLAAFMPVYLKTLWLVLLVTLWSLAVAVLVLVGSLISVLAGWTPTS